MKMLSNALTVDKDVNEILQFRTNHNKKEATNQEGNGILENSN